MEPKLIRKDIEYQKKTLIIVSILCENQDYLIQSLKEHGKWIENSELAK